MKFSCRSTPAINKRYVFLAYVLVTSILLFGIERYTSAASLDDNGPVESGLNIQMLDDMGTLPGELTALPAISPGSSQSRDEVELGKLLFFESRLSLDRSMSCASCHDPAKGFADGKALSTGFAGKRLTRHSPTILNSAFNRLQFWDGRSHSLEDQALGPIANPDEMNMVNAEMVMERLNKVPQYRELFQKTYGQGPTMKGIASAIAAFERTLTTPDSPFDQYLKGDKSALNASQKRGLLLFISKASCSQCHNGVNLTDNEFHNLGNSKSADLGRFRLTGAEKDKAAFKTPTLRNVALTAPYMHHGALKTLEEVVDYYNRGGGHGPNKSSMIVKLFLTNQEKHDLVAFLKSLTGTLPQISIPQVLADAAN
jgi:cytochrome c peroxidase